MLSIFITNPWQFYLARFLLGLAEAGFYPGVILYLTLWFPSSQRAKMTALFVCGIGQQHHRRPAVRLDHRAHERPDEPLRLAVAVLYQRPARC